jgi:hypothetical protein
MLFHLITFCAPLSKIRSAAQVRSGVGGVVTNTKKEMSIRTNLFFVFGSEGIEKGKRCRKVGIGVEKCCPKAEKIQA